MAILLRTARPQHQSTTNDPPTDVSGVSVFELIALQDASRTPNHTLPALPDVSSLALEIFQLSNGSTESGRVLAVQTCNLVHSIVCKSKASDFGSQARHLMGIFLDVVKPVLQDIHRSMLQSGSNHGTGSLATEGLMNGYLERMTNLQMTFGSLFEM